VTVYVDDMGAPYRNMIMYHMIADTDEELHAMADKIGVARRWWQAPPKHDSHYDISDGKRALACNCGARSISWREASLMTLARRWYGPDQPLITPEEGERLLSERWDARHPAYDYLPIILAVGG
jgi:hypothetical protein